MNQNPDPNFMVYAWLSFVSLCGSAVRAAQWFEPATGKFVWWKLALEVPTAVVLAVIAGSVAEQFHLDQRIEFGIAGVFGLIGPTAVMGMAQNWIGGLTNARSKPAGQ